MSELGGLSRPVVSASDAEQIARECFGFEAVAEELGSNQDRNYLLTRSEGVRHVLRIDHPVVSDATRDAQHAALDAYRAAGMEVPAALPGRDGALTQRFRGFAVRLSEFVDGTSFVAAGYLAPVVLREFGEFAAGSVSALAGLRHAGLQREHMWDLRLAAREVDRLAPAIGDPALRQRVLAASREAAAALAPLADALPVQAIHGDLSDDNVIGRRGVDARLHPRVLLDFGDLAEGWRVAELAVTTASLLPHEPARPVRARETVAAFHRRVPLSAAEVMALWPLVVLRAAVLVASGHRQLQLDGDNAYARERIAGEQALFDAATRFPLGEMTEQMLAATGAEPGPAAAAMTSVAATSADRALPVRGLLPELAGEVRVLDAGVESAALHSGRFLAADAEQRLVAAALADGAVAAVFPAGVFRLTRTVPDVPDAAPSWPLDTELWIAPGPPLTVTLPRAGRTVEVHDAGVTFEVSGGAHLILAGVEPSTGTGCRHLAGEPVGVVPGSTSPRCLVVGLRRADAPPFVDTAGGAGGGPGSVLVAPERVPAWSRFVADPAPLLGLPSLRQGDESDAEAARRERVFASAQERYYERPMQIERGFRHHLIDTTGRAYLDMVNNVTGLGHGHPGVAEAVSRQLRLLGTNSRFLYRGLAEYSERLLELLPANSGLDTVLLVNSGSEAVDLAIRLAQAATGRRTIVALREAYHGWTMASDAVTTSAFDNPSALASRPEWVHVADVPNPYRGTYRGAGSGARYAADLASDLERLAVAGRDAAGFICESVLGNAGGVCLPEGYLASAYELVRAAGGLCIADEVQVGFGRLGSSFWGFEGSGAVPDIIAIAKPMGNGFPIGGVITSRRIAEALSTQGQFFSTAGGNPVSCRAGIAVLDAMRDEGLQENARAVGERLRQGFHALARRHPLIGAVHGEGLYLGVELVRDRDTREPAAAEAAAICERLRELGVIVLTTSERSNVLKVKPPLCLTERSAELMLDALDRVLGEGW